MNYDPCAYFDITTNIAVVGLGSLAYGVHIAIATMTIFCATQTRKVEHLRRYYYFIASLLVFSTLNYCLIIIRYICNRLYPFYPSPVSGRVQELLVFLPELTAIIVSVLCNAFMMYRCYIVWNRWKPILIPPGALLIGALVGAVLTLYNDIVMFGDGIVIIRFNSFNALFSYWTLLIAVNITLSALISGRILFIHLRLHKLVGKDFSQLVKGSTTTLVALFIESSALYTVVSAAGLPVFIIGWDITEYIPYTFSPLLVHTECIASELIILRVIFGQAITSQWASATTNFFSTVKYHTTIYNEGHLETTTAGLPSSRNMDPV